MSVGKFDRMCTAIRAFGHRKISAYENNGIFCTCFSESREVWVVCVCVK